MKKLTSLRNRDRNRSSNKTNEGKSEGEGRSSNEEDEVRVAQYCESTYMRLG